MKTLLNPWFILGCLTWVVIYASREFGYPLPFVNGYIDDLFAIPVIANLTLCLMRVAIIRSNYYVLSASKVVFVVVYVSLVFEVILPLLSKRYTRDWLDALLYAIGGLFFYLVMNKPLASTNRKS